MAGIVGSLAGSLIYYAVGRRLGPDRARQAVARFGTLKIHRFSVQFMAVEDYDRAVQLFQRRGGVIVLVARLMPLVHSVVSIPAGVTQMPLVPFMAYTGLGSALWIAPLTLFGVWLGNNWEDILYWMDIYEYVWYAIIAVAIGFWAVRRVRNARSQHPQ